MSTETLQRQIEGRELSLEGRVRLAKAKALNSLAILQEKAVQEQHDSKRQQEIRAMTEPQKASANAVWIRTLITQVNEILLMTDVEIKFSETFFGSSLINCKVIGEENEKHVALVFGSKEIPAGTERTTIENAWKTNYRGERRSVRALASLTSLDVIGKAYSAVYNI